MSEQVEARKVVTNLTELIESLLPQNTANTSGPAEIQITSFKHGKGLGSINGFFVELTAHPSMVINAGDVVVGVPVAFQRYYVVGRVNG